MHKIMPKKLVASLLRDEIRRYNENLRQIIESASGEYMTESESEKANKELKRIYKTQFAYIRQTGKPLQEAL